MIDIIYLKYKKMFPVKTIEKALKTNNNIEKYGMNFKN